MSNAFDGLEPAVVWQNFAALTRIPRPSGHEARVREHLADWAREHGFEPLVDEVGNLLVRVPGTPGKEDAPTLVLQGHLDMVAEKNNDVTFDFLTQPLNVLRDGDWITADGTTLGADNGIGIAMAMAIAEDPQAAHPPLELLFTVEEETGLTGATNLQPGWVTGRRLINIDSEEEGYIFCGCAGGADTHTTFPLETTELPEDWSAATARVKGLAGGHSGLTIHENRGNALKFLARWLTLAADQTPLRLCLFAGGDKHNAIPREAEAIVAGPKGLVETLQKTADSLLPMLRQEFGRTDPKMELLVGRAGANEGLSVDDTTRFLQLVTTLHHGVNTMSKEIAGMVETSSNLARIDWEDEEAIFLNSSRSSVAAAIERIKDEISATAGVAGARAEHGGGYPGWQPDMNSRLLARAQTVFQETTGKEAEVTAIHAGLECGIIGEKYPGMDMISMGPDMFDVHSPDERLSIPSTNRFYAFLKSLIAAL